MCHPEWERGSGENGNVRSSLPGFLSHCNKNMEQWVKRCKTTDKLRLSSAQADRSFITQSMT